MGFRFGKSIRLGKGVRLNISKRGLGISAGVKGYRVSVGPRGVRSTVGIPGTGISYTSTAGGGRKKSIGGQRGLASQRQRVTAQESVKLPPPPKPGWFAPRHEKAFFHALNAYKANKRDESLKYFIEAAKVDACASIMAALLLSEDKTRHDEAIATLEKTLESDADFPTPLMTKYISSAELKLQITQEVQAVVPIDALGASLMLAELYQLQGRLADAIGLLEELDDASDEPVLTLSLCELYAENDVWDGIIDRAQKIAVDDDVSLEISVYRARAMQEKDLHEAAISLFTEMLRRKKGLDPELLREAVYWRAISYEKTGKKAQANKELQKIYAEAPDFRDVAQRLGV